MGKASISIAITGSYNGAAIDKAEKRLDSLAKKAAGADSNFGTLGHSLVTTGSQLAKVGGECHNFGSQLDSFSKKTAPASICITALGVATGAAAVKIDTALTGVKKTVDGTAEQYEQLKQSAIEFSKTNAVSADQILDIQALGAQLGFAIDELDDFSQVVSGLDIATDMNAETAATELAQFANITKMAHADASRYGSAIVNLGNNMATTESKISSMSMRIGAAGSQVKMSQAQILGWAGAMSSLGIEAEAGGTAFSQTLSMIDKQVATNGKNLSTFAQIAGMSAEQFKTSWQTSATDTMVALLKGAGAAENLTVVLEDMGVTGLRQTDVLKRLAGNTDLVSQAIDVANEGWTENTALSAEVENRNNSMAAKLEILGNKVIAIAEDVGTPLVDALTSAIDAAQPLIDVIETLTTAFNQSGDGTKAFVIGMGAVVALASPVSGALGKVAKASGDVYTAMGKQVQDIGVYVDAMTTSNAANLETYASNEKLSKALAKNPYVKAAGGVDGYVDAVKKANADTSALAATEKKLESQLDKGSSANKKMVRELTLQRDEQKKAAKASTEAANALKAQGAAASTSQKGLVASAAGMKALTTATNTAKVALASFAPMLVLTAVVGIIGAIADASSKAAEKERTMSEATSGLAAAAAGATNALDQEAASASKVSVSASDMKSQLESTIEKQAQLASTMRDTNTSAAAQSAQLNDAYSVIQQYANQTGLGASEQGKLKSAVETVNQMCGTQIQVTDAVNGKLADENGAINDVTVALGSYVDAKLEQIRMDAQQENLEALYKQQADDISTLAAAQQRYNEKLDQYMAKHPNMSREEAAHNIRNTEQARTLKECEEALDGVNTSIDIVTSSLGASAVAASSSSASITTLAAASPTVSAAMQAISGDIDAFSVAMGDAGVSVSTFSQMTPQQLSNVAASFDGTSASIVETMQSMGVEIADEGTSAMNALAAAIADGRVSVEDSTAIIQAAAAGDWSSVIAAMQEHGMDIPESVASGVSAQSYQASGATSAMMSAVALQLTNGNVEAAAQMVGGAIDEGLAQAIRDGDDEVLTSVYGLTQDTIDKAKEGFGVHSPSTEFQSIGSDIDAGLTNGISGSTDGPLGAIGSLVQGVIGGMSSLPGDMTKTGTSGSTGFASGIKSAISKASANASSMASAGKNGVSSLPGAMGTTGTSASDSFANALRAKIAVARSSAQAMSSTASQMGKGDAHQWGSHLSQNFATGIRSGITWVTNAARSVLEKAKSVMGFSVPEEGPWSGAEKGGETSGRHLAENFARGMLLGSPEIEAASEKLAYSAGSGDAFGYHAPSGTFGQTVNETNVYYTIGDVTIDMSKIEDMKTLEQLYMLLVQAKRGG